MSVTLTATAGGYYRIYVDGAERSQHQQEREAVEAALAVLAAQPSAVVEYDHDYRVRVEVPGAPPVEPDPDPAPEPEPEPPVEEPDPDPDPPPEPEPERWATGRWTITVDGQPGAIDFGSSQVTLPQFGTLTARVQVDGNSVTATFDLGAAHGAGTLALTHTDGRLAGSARAAGQTVSVTGQREGVEPGAGPDDPNDPLPPAPGAGDRPNEPQGFRRIAEREFTVVDAPGWQHIASTRGASAARFGIADVGGRRVGRVTFPAGHSGDGSSSLTPHIGVQIGTPRRFYLSFGLMVSPNWYGHTGATMSKIFYIGHPLLVMIAGSAGGRLTLRLSLQGGENFNCRWDGAENEVSPRMEDAEIVRGRWHQVEVLVETNTPGQANGRLHAWVDGRKILQYSSRRILAGATAHQRYQEIEGLRWHPIYGGQNGANVPAAMHQYIDHIYVSGAGGGAPGP